MNPVHSKDDFYRIVQALAREDVNQLIAGMPKSNPNLFEEAKLGPKKRKLRAKAKVHQEHQSHIEEGVEEGTQTAPKTNRKTGMKKTKGNLHENEHPSERQATTRQSRKKREPNMTKRPSKMRSSRDERPSTTTTQQETKRARRVAKSNPKKIVKVIPKRQKVNNYKPRTPLQTIKRSKINEAEKPHNHSIQSAKFHKSKIIEEDESESSSSSDNESQDSTEYDRMQIRAVAAQTTATSIKQHKKAQQSKSKKNRVLKHYPLKKKPKSSRIFHPEGLISETQISYRYIDRNARKPNMADEGVQTGSEQQRPMVIELDPPVPARPVVQRNNFLANHSRAIEEEKIESPQHGRFERERNERKKVSRAQRDHMFNALRNKLSAMQSEIHESQPNVPFEPLLVPEHIEDSTNLSEDSIPHELSQPSPPPSPEPLLPERVTPPKESPSPTKKQHSPEMPTRKQHELDHLKNRVASKQKKLDKHEKDLSNKYKDMVGMLHNYDDEMDAIRGRLEAPDSEIFSISEVSEIMSEDLSSNLSVQSSPHIRKESSEILINPSLLSSIYAHRDAQQRVNGRKAAGIGDICSDIAPHVLIEILAESILNDMVDHTANLMDGWCNDIVSQVFQQEFAIVGNHLEA